MKAFTFPIILLVLGLSACAPTIPRDPDSPYFAPPVGSKFILKKPVTIRPDEARAYFQNGAIVPRTINYYAPHCQLEVDDVLPAEQTVQPDTFTITEVSRDSFDVVQSGTTRIAGIGISIGLGMGDSDGVSDIMYAWRMKLESAKQPKVRTLICGGVFDYPADAEYPSINEMRRTLGDYAELNIDVSKRSTTRWFITPTSRDPYARQGIPDEK